MKNTPQASFLAPISVGRVKEVLSGNRIKLDNGIRVSLLGISSPSSKDSRSGFSCFGIAAQQYLESLIKNEYIFLRRDKSQMNEDGDLLRYVFLPLNDKRGRENFINEQLIVDGYGKYLPSHIDTKYSNRLKQAQDFAYLHKQGGWNECIEDLLLKK